MTANMAHSFLLKGGRIIDPASAHDARGDILVRDGKIQQIGESLSFKGDSLPIIDVTDQWVMPGFVDSQASFGEPGHEDIETIQVGSRRALKGGFVVAFLLPETSPPIDNQSMVKFILSEGEKSPLTIFPLAALTKDTAGSQMAEMNELRRAGAIAFSDGRKNISNSLLMRRILEYASMVKIPVISFPDDAELSNEGFANEGPTAIEMGFKATPVESEEIAIARDILLARLTKGNIHIGPISSKGSLDLLERSREQKLLVSSFTAPHYLFLTDKVLDHYLAEGKVYPPFRQEEDRQALIRACREGLIDYLVSDHSPHLPYEINQELLYAPYGNSTLEIAVAVAVESLIHEGGAEPDVLARLFSYNVSQKFNIPYGRLNEGDEANITVIDPWRSREVTRKTFVGRAYNSPFLGYKLRGFPSTMVSRGYLVMEGGELSLE